MIMADILRDPVRVALLILLAAMEIPAAVILVHLLIKAKKESDKQ